MRCSLKIRPNARNISTQHCWIVLRDGQLYRELAKRAQHRCEIQKRCGKNLTIFKLDPTPSNILQHVATGCRPNACNTLRTTMLQDFACVWPGLYKTFIKSIKDFRLRFECNFEFSALEYLKDTFSLRIPYKAPSPPLLPLFYVVRYSLISLLLWSGEGKDISVRKHHLSSLDIGKR